MKTLVRKYGTMNDKDLCEISLLNDNGVHVTILNYGATLERFEIPVPTGLENIIMSLETPEDYAEERNFLGGTVGRVAGRIKNGQWKHGSKVTAFPLNDGDNSLHGGGAIGLDNRPWNFRTFSNDTQAGVELTLFDADDRNNYPGNMKIIVTYTLDNEDNLKYQIYAYTDKTTLFNPTNHTYFRLDGPNEDIRDLDLQIDADYYIPVDDTTMPISGRKKVDHTVFDFRKPKKLDDVLSSNEHQIKVRNGLDHPFILNGKKIAAVLSSPSKNRKLIMSTDAESVVVYSANSFNHTGATRNLGEHDGITLEAQAAPQTGNELDAFVLIPGEKFSRTVNWKIEY